jgi:hypothetical protein
MSRWKFCQSEMNYNNISFQVFMVSLAQMMAFCVLMLYSINKHTSLHSIKKQKIIDIVLYQFLNFPSPCVSKIPFLTCTENHNPSFLSIYTNLLHVLAYNRPSSGKTQISKQFIRIQIKPVHDHLFYFLKIHFNIILPSMLVLQLVSFP